MIEIIISAVLGGAIGICGTYYGHRLARSTALEAIKITEFNKAAAIFRSVFVSEIFFLQENIKTGVKMPDEIINSDILIAHEKAKIIFEPFLPYAELEGFNTACENYKNSKDIYCEQTPNKIGLKSYKAELCRVYLTHINNLLEFAKPKM